MRHSVGQDATEVVREELIYVIYERCILLSIESPPEQRFTRRAVSHVILFFCFVIIIGRLLLRQTAFLVFNSGLWSLLLNCEFR